MDPSLEQKVLDRYRRLCSMREYCSSDVLKKVRKALAADGVSGSGFRSGASESGLRSGACLPVGLSRLEANGIENSAQRILASLIEDKYIDDRRYAEAFARDKSSLAGWGSVKIRYMLRAKGIPDPIIKDALGEIDGGKADDRLQKLALTKFKSLQGDPQWKIKLLRYLLGRGYQYDEVAPIVDSLKLQTGADPSEQY